MHQCTNHPVPVVMETLVTVQCTHSSNSQDELIQPPLYVVSQATSRFCSSLCIATLKRSNAIFEQQMSTCITTATWRSPHLCFPIIHLECVPPTWLWQKTEQRHVGYVLFQACSACVFVCANNGSLTVCVHLHQGKQNSHSVRRY